MSDCCSPGQGFPSASAMEQMALNSPVIWREICAIQQAILAAASQCQIGGGRMCTVVGGDTPMTFVTGVKEVVVINGGSGYVIDRPAVRLVPPSGIYDQFTGATAFTRIVTNGSKILDVTVTSQGIGYEPIPSVLTVTSVGGIGAELIPLIDGSSGVVGVTVPNGGIGYVVGDEVTATRAVPLHPAYVDAVMSVASVSITGAITGVRVNRPGTGYQARITSVEVVSSVDMTQAYPLGAGFAARAVVSDSGTVTGVILDDGGSGYAAFSPRLVISDPGTGATATVTVAGDAISSVSIVTEGTNYTGNATGSVLNPPTASDPTQAAQVNIVTSVNTWGTDPQMYYRTWAGLVTNKATQLQLNAVTGYFTKLGYSINIISNPATGNTILWKVCW